MTIIPWLYLYVVGVVKMRSFVFVLVLLFSTLSFADVTLVSQDGADAVISVNFTEPSPVDNDLGFCSAYVTINGGNEIKVNIPVSGAAGGAPVNYPITIGIPLESNLISVHATCSDLQPTPYTNESPVLPPKTLNIYRDLTHPGQPVGF